MLFKIISMETNETKRKCSQDASIIFPFTMSSRGLDSARVFMNSRLFRNSIDKFFFKSLNEVRKQDSKILELCLGEMLLYWEGPKQLISAGSNFKTYIDQIGFSMIDFPCLSLFIQSMKILTDSKLAELGLPGYVNIILPTSPDNLISDENGNKWVLKVCREKGSRKLTLTRADWSWDFLSAFLLCRQH